MDLDRTRTTFACACRRCDYRWLHEYEVVEWTDDEGAPVQWYTDHGIRVPSPQQGASCPRCAGIRVDAVPAHVGGAFADFETPPDVIELPEDEPAPTGGSRLPYGPPFPAF
jgi:hypothetical protein